MDKGFKHFLNFFIVIVIIFVFGVTIINNIISLYDKYREKEELSKKLIFLKNKENQLKVDVEKLQDSDYIAKYAREKYFYSKEGEIIFKIPYDE